jgi:aspartate/methionine/tyrosine aminotransferase
VALTPGEAFDAPGFARISYATSMKELERGSQRILEFLATRTGVGAASV